jgi:hypothetical protein
MRHRIAGRRRSGAQRRSEQNVRHATLAAPVAPDRPWTDDVGLGGAIARLPDRLTAAAELD